MKDFKEEGKSSPYASHILDYLRTTVTADSIEGAVHALEILSENFEIIRVKDRLVNDAPGKFIVG